MDGFFLQGNPGSLRFSFFLIFLNELKHFLQSEMFCIYFVFDLFSLKLVKRRHNQAVWRNIALQLN